MRSISSRAALAAVLYAAMAHAGHAQTYYKCINPQGKPEFSDQPCAASTRQEKPQPRSNTLDTPGLREQHLLQENQRLRQALDSEHVSRRQTCRQSASTAWPDSGREETWKLPPTPSARIDTPFRPGVRPCTAPAA